MTVSVTGANQSLDALAGSPLPGSPVNMLAYVSQHTGAPGATGTSEYAATTRVAATWNNASASAKTNSGALTLANSGASAVTDIGTWSASSAGTFGAPLHLASSVTAASISVASGALSYGSS